MSEARPAIRGGKLTSDPVGNFLTDRLKTRLSFDPEVGQYCGQVILKAIDLMCVREFVDSVTQVEEATYLQTPPLDYVVDRPNEIGRPTPEVVGQVRARLHFKALAEGEIMWANAKNLSKYNPHLYVNVAVGDAQPTTIYEMTMDGVLRNSMAGLVFGGHVERNHVDTIISDIRDVAFPKIKNRSRS